MLLLEQCLQAGGEEHQHGEKIALPGRGLGVTNKLQEEAGEKGHPWLLPLSKPGQVWRTRQYGFFFRFLQKWLQSFPPLSTLIFSVTCVSSNQQVEFLPPPVMG